VVQATETEADECERETRARKHTLELHAPALALRYTPALALREAAIDFWPPIVKVDDVVAWKET